MNVSTQSPVKAAAVALPALGIDLPFEEILASCYPRADDIIFVSGTLVEGIGNRYSDIDVYVITDRYRSSAEVDLSRHHRVLSPARDIIRGGADPQDVMLIHTVVPGTAAKIDVEYKTFDEVQDLFARVHDIFTYASQNLILLTKRLTDREEAFIHRLFNCVPVQNPAALGELLKGIRLSEYSYLGYRWVASDFAVLLDIAGAWSAGELDRAVELARENAFTQLAGYLRLRGLTNFRRKWLLTYLERMDVAGIRARFIELMYMRGADDTLAKADYVRRALDFVDDLFSLAHPVLAAMSGVPSGARALDLLRRDRKADGLANEYADWELAYRSKAYGLAGAPTRTLLRGSGLPGGA